MKLDSAEQKLLLLKFIDTAPVQGPMAQVLELAAAVSELRQAIEIAEIEGKDNDPA